MTNKPVHEAQRHGEGEDTGANRPVLDGALETLFNLSLDMLCVADLEGYFRIFNEAFLNTLGHSREELLRTPFIEFVHPEDRQGTLDALQGLSRGVAVTHFENRYRCRDGSYKWLAWTSVPETDKGFVYAVARDVSGQKATQRALQAQRDLFDNVLSNVPAAIFWKDRNSVYLGANGRFARDTGARSPAEFVGKTDYDLAWTREQADFYRECDREVMDSGEPMLNIEESLRQADGKRIELITSKVPLLDDAGRVAGILGIYMDITQRKQAEVALQKSEARLQTLFDSAAEFIFVINPEGTVTQVNQYACEHSGYSKDEITGRNIKEFLTDESRHVCDCNFPVLRERGYNRAEVEFACKDGDILNMECSATAVPDEEGEFTSFLIIQRDVTERIRAATALANSERRFRTIFNSTYQLIGLLDRDGTVLEANQTALDFGGFGQADVVGRPFWEIVWWNGSEKVQQRLRDAVQRAARGKAVRYEEEVLDRDQRTRIIDFTLRPVLDEQGRTVRIIPEGRDITESRQAEYEKQRHQQEMAHIMRLGTMGEMASGIAHELNQPLTALVSYCGTASSLVDELPAAPPQLPDILERATEQAHRAGRIIHHLRALISKGDNSRERLDLDGLVRDVMGFLDWEFQENNVTLEFQADGQSHAVEVDKIQIEQVLINLARNSLDAIRGTAIPGGRVLIQGRRLPDASIEVTVTDNGPGIAADRIGTIFDPFQTDKESGMGIGLSLSRTIIETHDGNLWVDKKHQDGARLGFVLPGVK